MPNPSFWCDEHQREWFKTPNMHAYSHPVEDENGEPVMGANGKSLWCPMIKTAAKPVPRQAPPATQVRTEHGGSGIGPNGPPEPLRSQSTMSKADWSEKDRITRVSIHRQSASQRGVELVVGEAITFGQMPPWIKAFETYYATGEWPVRPLTGYEKLSSVSLSTPSPVPPATPPSAYPMCPIKGHESMPLNKKTKDGSPAHEFTDDKGARHKCIPELDHTICAKHNIAMRQDAQGGYYHAVDENAPEPEICKGK